MRGARNSIIIPSPVSRVVRREGQRDLPGQNQKSKSWMTAATSSLNDVRRFGEQFETGLEPARTRTQDTLYSKHVLYH